MFKNMKIGKRLAISFSVVALLLITISVLAIVNLANINKDIDNLVHDKFPKTVWANTVVDYINVNARCNRNILLLDKVTQKEDIAKEFKRIADAREIIDNYSDSLKATMRSEKGKALYAEFESKKMEYRKDAAAMRKLMDEGKWDEAKEYLFKEVRVSQLAYMTATNNIIDYQTAEMTRVGSEAEAAVSSAEILIISIAIAAILLAIFIAFWITRSITKPINGAVEAADKIAIGNFEVNLDSNSKDETGLLIASMKKMKDTISDMVSDTKTLAKAAVDGKLDTRAKADKYQGEFNGLITGINNTLDAVIGPLNVAAEYVDRISKGDIPPKITDQYNGDFNEIKNNLNGCIDSVNHLVTDALMLAKAAVDGKLDTRADASKHTGKFRDIVEGVNKTLDNVIGPLNVAAEYVDRISKGDIPPKITDQYHGDFNEIKNNLNQCIDSVNALVSDAVMLAKAAVDGKLDTRADASKHGGKFRDIVEGVNKTLDSVIGPLNVAAEYVDRISKGDIPPKITDNYHGDFNEIKNNLNQAIDAISALVKDAVMLAKAAKEGRFATRADASKHGGDFKAIVEGVNNTLDDVIGPLNVAADYVDKISKGNIPEKISKEYFGDFNVIKNNLNVCIEAFDRLVADAKMLAVAAVEGRLNTRADATKHSGDFRAVVEGVNATIDSLMDPVNEATEILAVMANGDLTTRMVGDSQGDHMKLKDSINTVQDSLSALIKQVGDAVQSAASAAMEITATAESLAASSEEQSAQADEVASAVEEMSRTITENAMAANRTSDVAKSNGNIAKEGGTVVEQTVNKMRDIAGVVKQSADNIEKLGESSKQIGEIISVIDDIADQTNLLALNAAIEAARAGEQGRGFAVVADEVRKLAERTTEATKQIAIMIKGIQSETQEAVVAMKRGNDEVSSGITLADRAGSSLKEIVVSTQDVMDMINQIAAASEEQSSTSEQISKNVSSISQVTNESTKRVQDIAHSSDDLSKLTEHLKSLVDQFKVESDMDNFGGFKKQSMKKFQKTDKKHLPPGQFY